MVQMPWESMVTILFPGAKLEPQGFGTKVCQLLQHCIFPPQNLQSNISTNHSMLRAARAACAESVYLHS